MRPDDRSSPAGDFQRATIDSSGRVLVDEVEVGLLQVVEGALRKIGDNFWEGNAQPVATPELAPGQLEGSNVDAVRVMVLMTSLMRQFEANQKAVQTQDELLGQLIRSLAER